MKTSSTQPQIDARRKLAAAMRERTDEPLRCVVTNKDTSRFCAMGFVQNQLRQYNSDWYWVNTGIIFQNEPMHTLDNKKIREEYNHDVPVPIPNTRDQHIERFFAMDVEEQNAIFSVNDSSRYSWGELADYIDEDTDKLQLMQEGINE